MTSQQKGKISMRKLLASLFVLIVFFKASQVEAQVTGATSPIPWAGGANVWSLAANGTDPDGWIFWSAWGVADLKTTTSGSFNQRLVLQPNFNAYNSADVVFWRNNNGAGPGGNKYMDLTTYVDRSFSKYVTSAPVSFAGTINSHTLATSYRAEAYIKVIQGFAPYNTLALITTNLTASNSSFRIQLDLSTAALGTNSPSSHNVQYGFMLHGVNANPTQETALGNVDVTVTEVPAVLGPQIGVSVNGQGSTDESTNTVISPLIGRTARYLVTVESIGTSNLVVSNTVMQNVSLLTNPATSGTNSFSLQSGLTNVTLPPGVVRSFLLTASPTNSLRMERWFRIMNNDVDSTGGEDAKGEQWFRVYLKANPVNEADDFNTLGTTPAQLGWSSFYSAGGSWATNPSASSLSVTGGTLKFTVDSQNGIGSVPWYYGVQKTFASPGPLNLSNSTLAVSLKASGAYTGYLTNKVQVFLESLNLAGQPTGRLSLGQWVDETTTGSTPGAYAPGGTYDVPDGNNDRVALLLAEGATTFTTVSGSLATAIDESSTAILPGASFDPAAPAFRVAVLITDREFDLDANNTVEIDYVNMSLVTDSGQSFTLANSGFEADTSLGATPAEETANAPSGWRQWARHGGVNKSLMTNGAFVYDQSATNLSSTVTFSAAGGSKALKIYPQNFYGANGQWESDWGFQGGVVYQEWSVSPHLNLIPGAAVYAQSQAKVFSIDPLTGGNTFKFGFRYLDSSGQPIPGADQVATMTAADPKDVWATLTALGTIPASATKIQVVAEFNQNSALGYGSVYIDNVSVGFGSTPPAPPTDLVPPVFTLNGASLVSLNWGATYSDAGATAFDAGDNASVAVTTNNPVNPSVPGSYLVIYTATDSKSNSATTNRTVNVTMANSGTNRGADGLTDVMRYAFGGTGTSSISSTLLPSNTVNGGNLVLTYYTRTNSNVNLVPAVSTDLANSNSWTNTGITVSNLATVTTNGTTLEKRQASTPVSGNKKFLRLKATYTP
jgi:hypothetical protein